MNSGSLPLRHFAGAVSVRALPHALAFGIVTSIFSTILVTNPILTAGVLPATILIYISAYAVHELGHYLMAVLVRAEPVLWIDYSSVSVISNPQRAIYGRLIALAGPLAAAGWIIVWWVCLTFILSALRFATLIPGVLLASAHLGSLLPVFSDGKTLMQSHKRSYT